MKEQLSLSLKEEKLFLKTLFTSCDQDVYNCGYDKSFRHENIPKLGKGKKKM